MKTTIVLAISLAALSFAAPVHAASSYQVTGPVLEVTDAKVVIQKGKEQWEIFRTAATQITGDLKVGSKITIQYTMTASTIAVKADKAEKTVAPKPAKKEKPVAMKPEKTEKPALEVKPTKPAPEVKPAKPAKPTPDPKSAKPKKPADAPETPVKKAA
jgi:outer membrane biosynthesis protein TonB